MENSFNDLYLKRRSTFNFDNDKDFDMDKFKEVMELFSSNMPSKQHKYPYNIHVVDWSNQQLREEIVNETLPQIFPGQCCFYNNQVLAPVLICFTNQFDPEPYIAPIEIGMALMSLTYLLQNNGFLTSFCQCIENPNNLAEKITGEDNITLQVILPVGQHTLSEGRQRMYKTHGKMIPQKHRKHNSTATPNIKYHIDS